MLRKQIFALILLVFLLAIPLGVAAETSPLTVEMNYVNLALQQDTLVINEALRVNNPGKEAYNGVTVNGKKITLEIPLPKGYKGIQVAGMAQNEVVTTDNGIALTTPIPAGKKDVELSYYLDGGKSFDLSRTVVTTTTALYVLTREKDLQISSDILVQGEEIQMGEAGSFRQFYAQDLTPGQTVTITTAVAPAKSNILSIVLYLSIALVVLAAAALIFILWRRRRDGGGDEPNYQELIALLKRAKRQYRLTEDKLASLDQEHQEGTLSSEEYQAKSEIIEEKLEGLKKQIRTLEVKIEEYEEDDGEDDEDQGEYEEDAQDDANQEDLDAEEEEEISEYEQSVRLEIEESQKNEK